MANRFPLGGAEWSHAVDEWLFYTDHSDVQKKSLSLLSITGWIWLMSTAEVIDKN